MYLSKEDVEEANQDVLRATLPVKHKLEEESNIKVIDKSIEKNSSLKKETLIEDIEEVKTIKEIKILVEDPPKDDIKIDKKETTTNDSLSADEDKTIKR